MECIKQEIFSEIHPYVNEFHYLYSIRNSYPPCISLVICFHFIIFVLLGTAAICSGYNPFSL